MAGRGVRPPPSSLEDTEKNPTGAVFYEGPRMVDGSEPLCLSDLVAEKGTSYVTERI